MGEKINAYAILVGKSQKGTGHLEDLDGFGNILKWIS
jgi:hypothetical protein